MKATISNSQELRREIQSLVQARESLETNNDISGTMVKINNSLNSIKPLMVRQTEFIKNFLQTNTTSDSTSKQAQTRRYLARISDISLNQMNQLLSIGDKYFSIDIRNSWNKVRNSYEKQLQLQKQHSQKSNPLEFLFKLMNIKDKLFKEFLKSLIYRKCLLWKDLNITSSGYVHFQKKKITKLIEDNILNKKYAPTKPFFAFPAFDTPGQWSLNKVEFQDAPLAQILKLLNEQVEQTYSTVRNYSGLNEEQRNHEDIRRNNEIVRSLREEIEQAHINYQLLEKKYREAISKDEKLDVVELKEKFRVSQQSLQAAEQELRKLKFEYRDYTANMNAQKEKIKELETDLQRINGIEMKKLKEVELLQFSLSEQVSRISKNMSSFGSMFEFQSEGKKSLASTIISQKEIIEKMAVILGRHKNQIKKLQQEIKRLNLIIIELGIQIKQLKNSPLGIQ